MLIVEAWHLYGKPQEVLGVKTVSEALDRANASGFAAVRVALDGGSETFRRIAGEWVCTASV